MRRAVALCLILAAGCSLFKKKKTDAELAAEERKAARASFEKSLVLVPYRGLKITFRSSGAKQVPEALAPLHLMTKQDADPIKLVKALYDGRKALEGLDEDTFPTMWQAYFGAPMWPGYDSAFEHLMLAAFWLSLDSTKAPPAGIGQDIVLYELDRAQAPENWPVYLQMIAHLTRGISYAHGGWHYAAEEEINKYLEDIEKTPPEMRVLVAAVFQRTTDEVFEGGRALGYFVRAWNRTALGRKEQATDDVEKGLAALEKIGVDNELTQWGWALVHQRRGRYAKSAESLAKLAQSPNLDEEGKAAVRACAEEMKKQGSDPGLFSKPHTMMLIGRAMVARAGGMEKVMVALLGDEKGKAIYAKLTWMDRARHALSPKNALDFVKEKIK
jgi:hypothetical protein